MKPQQADQFLLAFTANLKNRGRLPKNIEISSLSSGAMASVFDSAPGTINESVFCGIDPDPATAILKGLVEMVERQAFSEGHRNKLASCQTERSDGFAAFPLGTAPNEAYRARKNALAEAIERFVWATWWDDVSIAYEQRDVHREQLQVGETLLCDLFAIIPPTSVTEIRPLINNNDHVVIIYFAFFDSVGVVSGGACGNSTDLSTIRYRALAELLRHGLAITKLKTNLTSAESFYERRLAYFGLTEEGTGLVRHRLSQQGTSRVNLPKLAFDHEVPHSLSDLVVVHRCYFENQPDFVGGRLERLCL